jgi:hypothetical protein
MLRGFILASGSPGGTIGSIPEYPLAVGYAEAQGALGFINSSGQFEACGADPALIGGVANTPGGPDTSGFNILGRKEFPAGYMQVIALKGRRFRAPYVGALPAAYGGQYGVIRDSDGVWKVDFNEVANVVVNYVPPSLTESPLSQAEVICTFLDSVQQPI